MSRPETGTGNRSGRVLLVAYSCNPEKGSEPGVGWNRAQQAAREFETWVICEGSKNRESISRWIDTHGAVPGLRIEYVDKPAWMIALGRIPGLFYLSYHLWHRRAFRFARVLHAQQRFDLVHQVTFSGYREPGYLWRLDAPFVWGPIGGTQQVPLRFLTELGPAAGTYEVLRSLVNQLQRRFSPRVRRAGRRAAAVLAATSTAQRDLAPAFGFLPPVQLETGIGEISEPPQGGRTSDRVRIAWCGRLVRAKGLSLLLKALAQVPTEVEWELRILGDGPARRAWRELAKRLRLERRLRWVGSVPHAEVPRELRAADLFVFTSLRDTSGNALLEALACGLPVISLDHQGAHDIVTPDCGIRIPPTTPVDTCRAIAEAIDRLARDEGERRRLAQGAVARAHEYLWTRQGERMAEIYRRVLSGAKGRERRRPLRAGAGDTLVRGVQWSGGRAAAILDRSLGSRDRGAAGLLLYHRIADGRGSPALNVTPDRFRAQIAGLLDRGFAIWPLVKLLDWHASGRAIPSNTLALTFDDGFATVFAHAYPALLELNVPATVFLATAFIDDDRPFPFDTWGRAVCGRVPALHYRPLSGVECEEMRSSGLVELGSHGHAHADFRRRPAALADDIRRSLDVLRERFSCGAVPYAFPFGRRHLGFVDPDLLEAARATGVTCALTTDAGLVRAGGSPFGWGRFNVYQSDTAATLAAKLHGWYAWVPALQPAASFHQPVARSS